MNIRTRLAVTSATAVAVVVVVVTGIAYVAEMQDLRGGIDLDLRNRSAAIATEILGAGEVPSLVSPEFGTPVAYAQMVSSAGEVVPLAPGMLEFPVDARVIGVAEGRHDRFYTTLDVADVQLRVLTIPLRPGTALQVGRPVDEIDFHAFRLGMLMGLLAVAGIGFAVVLGRFVARSALRPVELLTEAAERVARTRDLAHRIDIGDETELGRLAEAMNSMVAALDDAHSRQQQLVTDASHELQTPIAVLMSNLEMLERSAEDPRLDKAAVLIEMRTELAMMSRLATNLVELARPSSDPVAWEFVAVDEVVGDLIESISTVHAGLHFEVDLERCLIRADVDRLSVALGNLLENAVTWTDAGGSVSVRLAGGMLAISDEGPGIDPGDLPRIFAAFYRSAAARALPGSGLGLAIVRRTAEEHGWSLAARNRPQGGTEITVGFHTGATSEATASERDRGVVR